MGTVLLERVPQQCQEKVSIRERGCKKKAVWSNNRPNVDRMGRRQSQKKPQLPQLPQYSSPSQDNNNEKRLQQRRRHKPHTPSTKRKTSHQSAQATSESKSQTSSPGEKSTEPAVQPAAQRCSHREHKHSGYRGSRHTPAFPCHRPSEATPADVLNSLSLNSAVSSMSGCDDGDSDTDLSESERLPVSPSRWDPPQLDLRPEVIEDEKRSSRIRRPRGRGDGGFDFPDFLPPPFNSWSLSQLAVFYNVEGRGGPRPRAVGPLERYLERLLQLEWCQIQTVQEESGKSAVSEVISGCHRSPAAAATSRLSSPKCILQSQRAFPLTLLSSLASHSALLSGCACTLCRIRYAASCGTSCCLPTHSHTRQSRLSPTLEQRGPTSLPKRSYSESRVQSSERSSGSRAQRFSSPTGTNSHLRRMQASGNLRTSAQGANMKPHSTPRDCSVWGPFGALWDVWDYRTAGFRRRSGSEQRRSGVERTQGAAEKRRSGSECRRGGSECRKTSGVKDQEIKPDAVTAIMDNLPGKMSPMTRSNRPKQVEFVT
ncbi:serine/arginine repetitive matrix protein 4 isoform X2 [Labrus bergylta]|uniref:serine/arginine repetitive matrix protein 4 isoform X2 n=1 Tax=Labrus bergylta TaxID=56723 RepID=UPI003313F9EE